MLLVQEVANWDRCPSSAQVPCPCLCLAFVPNVLRLFGKMSSLLGYVRGSIGFNRRQTLTCPTRGRMRMQDLYDSHEPNLSKRLLRVVGGYRTFVLLIHM